MSEISAAPKPKYGRMALGAIAIAALVIAVAQNAPSKGLLPPKPTPADEGYLLANAEGIVKSVIVKVGDELHEDDVVVFLNDEVEVAAYGKAQDELQKVAGAVKGGDVALALPAEKRISGKLVSSGGGNDAPIRTQGLSELPAVSGGGTRPQGTAPLQPIVSGVDDSAKKAAQGRLDEANTALADLRRQQSSAEEEATQGERALPKLEDQILVTRREADKQRMLLQQGAVPANASARADAAYMQAQGALQIAKGKAEEARALATSLEKQIAGAAAEVADAQIGVEAASKVEVSASATPRAEIRGPSRTYVRRSQPNRVVHVDSAPPAEPTRVVVDFATLGKLDVALDGAKEKVDKAEEALLARRVLAVKGIRVLEILVKPGDKIREGQPIARWKHVPALDAPPFVPWTETLMQAFGTMLSPVLDSSTGSAPTLEP